MNRLKDPPDKVRAHVIISGLVQGVFFRYTAKKMACEMGICGWVKNRADGYVEAVFEGKRWSVESMIDWSRHGPPGAIVRDIEVDWEAYKGEFKDFHII